MQVQRIKLSNFRNYREAQVDLDGGKTVLIGANAQGKSNLLEAVEIAATGRSSRALNDDELIGWGADSLRLEVSFSRQGSDEDVSIALTRSAKPGRTGRSLDRQIMVNGVTQASTKALLGRLVTVSFKSQDLNLLRGGPKFRRDWLDSVITRMKPTFHDTLATYQKVVTQRNRLLKEIFERHKLTVTDQDQLVAWDKQLGRYGAQVIKQRLTLLADILPAAARHQSHLSGHNEKLEAEYLFRAPETTQVEGREEDHDEPPAAPTPSLSVARLMEAAEEEIATMLVRLLKERRGEEIGRKQTLIGPHRDDLTFSLNEASAVSFASQGQQRSLVLAMKLAELELIADHLDEPPVLLLDDVLAELDVKRQGLLMSAVLPGMQTIITTTHLTSFDPSWLAGARVLEVESGRVSEHLPVNLGK